MLCPRKIRPPAPYGLPQPIITGSCGPSIAFSYMFTSASDTRQPKGAIARSGHCSRYGLHRSSMKYAVSLLVSYSHSESQIRMRSTYFSNTSATSSATFTLASRMTSHRLSVSAVAPLTIAIERGSSRKAARLGQMQRLHGTRRTCHGICATVSSTDLGGVI
jgi:hypothetical protein